MKKIIAIVIFCFLSFNFSLAQNPLKSVTDAVETRYSSKQPVISYLLTIDKSDLSSFGIEMRISSYIEQNKPGSK